jgi:multicomponent Na+:H+ antiporter subunit C
VSAYLPFVVPAWIFVVGVYGIATSRHLVHLIVCLSVAQSSTYVLLLEVGYRTGATAPVYSDVLPGTRATDPVVQALALTDIVVGATVTALLLALALRVFKRLGTCDPQSLGTMKG